MFGHSVLDTPAFNKTGLQPHWVRDGGLGNDIIMNLGMT